MTDGAWSYTHNRALRELLAERGIRHIVTPPYTPRWNGKVERFHQTMEREWAKGLRYRNQHRPQPSPATLAAPLQPAQTPQLTRRPTTDQPRSQPLRAGQLVGLRPRHPLWAPASSASQAKRFVRRRSTDARIAEGTRKGAALARTGELQRQAKQYLAVRPKSIERERQLERQGAALGNARAARFLERREGRARDLGFPNLRAYYRQRYVTDRLRLADVTRELACAESAVRADLSRLGLGPDRTRSHGARWAVSR